MRAEIRAMEPEDVERVAEIEAEVFSAPWSARTFGRLLEQDGVEPRVMETPDGRVIGYAVLWYVLDQGQLGNIAIVPELRGRGLGGRLLDRTLEVARERGVRQLHLEVRESNRRAYEMYARRGFREIGRRKSYYDHPREDARVLAKTLEPPS